MTSGSRSRQAHLLGRLLSERLGGHRVGLVYTEQPPKGSRYTGWQVRWTDGPTVTQMQKLVAELAEQVPAVECDGLRYSRGYTDHSEAVGVLLWLDADPQRATTYAHYSSIVQYGRDEVPYPERAQQIWQRRATALQTLSGNTVVSGAVYSTLIDRVRTDGWAATLRWLDDIADGGRRLRIVR